MANPSLLQRPLDLDPSQTMSTTDSVPLPHRTQSQSLGQPPTPNRFYFEQRPVSSVVMEDAFLNNELANLALFRRHLGALLAIFQTLQPEERTKAVAMAREALGRMQAVIKYQLCNDALKTVAALAENMIQEAYGFTPNHSDLGLATSPPIISNPVDLVSSCDVREFHQSSTALSSVSDRDLNDTVSNSDLSIDNTDVLTNALYATLQAVNPCELSPPIHQPQSCSGLDQTATAAVSIPSLPLPPSFPFAHSKPSTGAGRSASQLTLTSFFAPTPSSGTDVEIRLGKRLLKCSQCDYVASHRQNLHRHEKLHRLRQLPLQQHRRFACALCDLRFVTKWAVKEHTKYKHPDASASEAGVSSPTASQGQDGLGPAMVPLSTSGVGAPAQSTIPSLGSGGDNSPAMISMERLTHSRMDELSNAVEIVLSKNFKCDYCGKAFPLRNAMKRHIAMVHFKNRDYQCSQCEKAFGDNYHLQRHVQTVHMALRAHECPVCRKAFSSSYHVSRHVKNLHK